MYDFEKETLRLKCKLCRKLFCMPNCGLCPNCKQEPEQEGTICMACLEDIFTNHQIDYTEANPLKEGNFAAYGHDEVVHRCSKDKEFHLWRREANG